MFLFVSNVLRTYTMSRSHSEQIFCPGGSCVLAGDAAWVWVTGAVTGAVTFRRPAPGENAGSVYCNRIIYYSSAKLCKSYYNLLDRAIVCGEYEEWIMSVSITFNYVTKNTLHDKTSIDKGNPHAFTWFNFNI